MGRPRGINQKQISFKVDNDLWSYIEDMSGGNRNRWLNNLIREAKKRYEFTQKYIDFRE